MSKTDPPDFRTMEGVHKSTAARPGTKSDAATSAVEKDTVRHTVVVWLQIVSLFGIPEELRGDLQHAQRRYFDWLPGCPRCSKLQSNYIVFGVDGLVRSAYRARHDIVLMHCIGYTESTSVENVTLVDG